MTVLTEDCLKRNPLLSLVEQKNLAQELDFVDIAVDLKLSLPAYTCQSELALKKEMKFSLRLDSLIGSQVPYSTSYDAFTYELTIKFKPSILQYKQGSVLKLILVASARTVNTDYTVNIKLDPLAWCQKSCASAAILSPPTIQKVKAIFDELTSFKLPSYLDNFTKE